MFHTGYFLSTDGALRGDSRGIRRGLLLVDFNADFQINWLFWLLRGLGRLRGCNHLLKETQLGVPLLLLLLLLLLLFVDVVLR